MDTPRKVIYLGRQPAAKDMLGRLLEGLGGVLRATGVMIDGAGSSLLGKAAPPDKLTPNLAWAPFKHDEAIGTVVPPGELLVDPARPALGSLLVNAPARAGSLFVAPSAHVIGNVALGAMSSVWYGAVLRGDVNAIRIGDKTNIQDNVIIHVARETAKKEPRPTIIGNNCTIGHGAIVHAATIGDNCLVGMGATVLDGAKLESGSMVAAGAVVTPGTVVPSGQIFAGNPAKALRALTTEESSFIAASADNYSKLAAEHSAENRKPFEELVLDRAIREERAIRDGTDIDAHVGVFRDQETQAVLTYK